MKQGDLYAKTFRRGDLAGTRRDVPPPTHTLVALTEEMPTSHPDVVLTVWQGAGRLFATAFDRVTAREIWYDVVRDSSPTSDCMQSLDLPTGGVNG